MRALARAGVQLLEFTIEPGASSGGWAPQIWLKAGGDRQLLRSARNGAYGSESTNFHDDAWRVELGGVADWIARHCPAFRTITRVSALQVR